MNRKTTDTYKAVFKHINENIFNLNATAFMTDYECGMRIALREIYPDAKLLACWFHYCQAIRRKCSKIVGFLVMLQKNKAAEKLFLKFLALPLLPAGKIREAFELLKLNANTLENKKKLFPRFLKYFEYQWLNRVDFFLIRSPLRGSNHSSFMFYRRMKIRSRCSMRACGARVALKATIPSWHVACRRKGISINSWCTSRKRS